MRLFFKLFLFLSFLVSATFTKAQGAPKIGILSGIILDSISKKPIDYASIRVLSKKDSSVVSGIFTDEKGTFLLDQIPAGSYHVKISFTGYQPIWISNLSFTPAKPNQDLGTIRMQLDGALNLQEVKVTADAPNLLTNSLDKKIYNVGEDLSTRGGTANDVLNNVPSVEVDQEGGISLRGDGNVTILIDGRPSTLSGGNGKSLLDALPANSIERIEIVTNPSAKYDPDGTSGIINIVLKKNKLKGINGNVSLSAGTGNVYNGSASLSVRNARMNVYGTYAYRYYEGFRDYESDLQRRFGDSLFRLDQYRNGTDMMENHTAKIGADFYLKNRQTLGIGVTGALGSRERTGKLTNNQLNQDDDLQREWYRNSSDPSTNQNVDINLNYKLDFKEEKGSLIVDINQSIGDEDTRGFYDENYGIEYGSPSTNAPLFQQLGSVEKNYVTTAQIDYVKMLPKSVRVEAGTKVILRDMTVSSNSQTRNNASGDFEQDTLSNFDYSYNEQIYSVYGNAAHQYKKFKYQAGIRLEQAVQAPDLTSQNLSFRNEYFSAFPSAFVKYELSKESELSLSYSRRINRPSANTLNPFTSYADPFNLRRGNPAVRPEYINSFDFGYGINKKKMNVTASVFYRQTNEVITRVKEFYDNGTTAVTYANINESQSVGLELVMVYRPFPWFRNMISANGNQITFSDDTPGTDWNNSGFNWSVKYAGTVDFWKKTASAQLNARYNAPIVTAQGIVQPRANVDFSVEKSLAEKKWSVGIRVSDIFNTQEFRLRVEQPNTFQTTRFKQETRRVYLTVSYKFGRYEVSKKDRMPTDNGGGGMDF